MIIRKMVPILLQSVQKIGNGCLGMGILIPFGISQIIGWFKTFATNEYIKFVKIGLLPPFDGNIWQRSYHDRIIRNEIEYDRIYEYIQNNPINWALDCHNPNNVQYSNWQF